MHFDLRSILMVFAVVFFLLSAFGVSGPRMDKHQFTAAGLFCWAFSDPDRLK